jgi:glutathione S-transferase
MLTIHHLGRSQSERIVWLCEELGIPYELKLHVRDSVTRLSPPELRALHPMGAAPVIEHDDLMLAESGAIMEYVIAKFGDGRLALPPSHPDYAKYLYWFHFANSNLQPVMARNMLIHRLDLPDDHPVKAATRERLDRALGTLETRLSDATWLAGDEFTAADIMIVFTLTTMRLFYPLDLGPWPHTLAYLQRIGARPAYQAAMKKGDPDLVPMLT